MLPYIYDTTLNYSAGPNNVELLDTSPKPNWNYYGTVLNDVRLLQRFSTTPNCSATRSKTTYLLRRIIGNDVQVRLLELNKTKKYLDPARMEAVPQPVACNNNKCILFASERIVKENYNGLGLTLNFGWCYSWIGWHVNLLLRFCLDLKKADSGKERTRGQVYNTSNGVCTYGEACDYDVIQKEFKTTLSFPKYQFAQNLMGGITGRILFGRKLNDINGQM